MKKTFLALLAVICCNMLRAEGFDAAARWISANSGEADEVNTWVAAFLHTGVVDDFEQLLLGIGAVAMETVAVGGLGDEVVAVRECLW